MTFIFADIHPTQGSARPEGGREAPALGGGSGAAQAASTPGGFSCDVITRLVRVTSRGFSAASPNLIRGLLRQEVPARGPGRLEVTTHA